MHKMRRVIRRPTRGAQKRRQTVFSTANRSPHHHAHFPHSPTRSRTTQTPGHCPAARQSGWASEKHSPPHHQNGHSIIFDPPTHTHPRETTPQPTGTTPHPRDTHHTHQFEDTSSISRKSGVGGSANHQSVHSQKANSSSYPQTARQTRRPSCA
jgi:hypothetical protein